MKPSTVKKVLGTVVAAITLTMVTSVAPASAAKGDADRGGNVTIQKRDTGWDIP